MEPKVYEVSVLHFENPHILWVEVKYSNQKTPTWEQIGIYGVLPCITTLSITTKLYSERCGIWQHAAYERMKEQLHHAKKIWFTPNANITYRTSIFVNCHHKFGEIIIEKDNGKLKKLSKMLIESGFACYDANKFEKELKHGKLPINLDKYEAKAVINKIERHYLNKTHSEHFIKALNSQTCTFSEHTAQKCEGALTVNNINRHNKTRTKDASVKEKNNNTSFDYLLSKMNNRNSQKETLNTGTGTSGNVRGNLNKAYKSKHQIEDVAVSKSRRHSYDFEDPITGDRITRNKCGLGTKRSDEVGEAAEVGEVASNRTRNSYEHEDTKARETIYKSDDTDTRTSEEHTTGGGGGGRATRRHTIITITPRLDGQRDVEASRSASASTSGREESCGEQTDNLHSYRQPQPQPQPVTYTNMEINKLTNTSKIPGQGIEHPKTDAFEETLVAIGPPGLARLRLQTKLSNVYEVKQDSDTEGKTAVNDNHLAANIISDAENGLNKQNMSNCKAKELIQVLTRKKCLGKDELVSGSEESVISKQSHSKLLRRLGQMQQVNVSSDTSTSTSLNNSIIDYSVNNENNLKTHDSEDDVTEQIREIMNKLCLEPLNSPNVVQNEYDVDVTVDTKTNVNPFKNLDPNISGFVDKLVGPVLMVHSKMNKRIQPTLTLNDVSFSDNIRVTLKNLGIEKPMTLQNVTWFSILRGYSLFMISPVNSGKTLGYVPAVCRLVFNGNSQDLDSVGPICIIVCATAQAVNKIEYLCKKLLGFNSKVLGFYAGIDPLTITTSLLNGCDILIVTPSMLTRLLQDTPVSQIDLSRLQTFVLDDCERLSEIYSDEIKLFIFKIKEMLKLRVNNELKVQYIVASRVWCNFMERLARNVPDPVICIRAFQECVFYSKANTSVDFVKSSNKMKVLLRFMSNNDISKKTVVVCRSNEEVDHIKTTLKNDNYVVFACDNSMDLHELHNLNMVWSDYKEPTIGPVLVCCDYNLNHLNITDANYLIHFSLPQLFSMFCKRFSVLNDNYASMFRETNQDVKIKILLEDTNVEQLPKILNFIKRCSSSIPSILDEVCKSIILEKELLNCQNSVPICDDLLAYGECPDFYNCKKRHKVFNEDIPQEWIPKEGIVTFKILYYHTPIQYSARLLSNSVSGNTRAYPQSLELSMKMAIFYSKKINRRLHGVPKVGHICAAEIKLDSFVRCRILKILNKDKSGNPSHFLVTLIDEQRLEIVSGLASLYFLPDELKNIRTYVVQVRLASILPRDKDITFPHIAKQKIMAITQKDDNLFLRGKIVMSVGNCVFVDDLEACSKLTNVNEIVVQDNLKEELLELYAIPNPDHIPKLEKLCRDCGIWPYCAENKNNFIETPIKPVLNIRWAHLDSNDFLSVYFASAENPNKMFVRLVKFEACVNSLLKDIKRYVCDEALEPLTDIASGDIVLAEFPDDCTYERARIEEIVNKSKVKCFFVDQGDWREVSKKKVLPTNEKFVQQIPFQAIECRLIGVKPCTGNWSEFSTNWLCDNCFDNTDKLKEMYVKYFKKEKAECTGGYKYSVIMIDTSGERDVVLNQKMIDLNLAEECEGESQYFENITTKAEYESEEEYDWIKPSSKSISSSELSELRNDSEIFKTPIRSVPLVASDGSDDETSKWDFNMGHELKPLQDTMILPSLPTFPNTIDTISEDNYRNSSSRSDFEILPSPNLKELDSDDLTSPESSLVNMEIVKQAIQLKECETRRKPKVTWRQNKASISLKVLLVGVQEYKVEINKRTFKFFAEANDVEYEFEFELYGVIDCDKSSHSNKGQYIFVKLCKVLPKNWLHLTKNGSIYKWIVVDADAIDTSSDEEQERIFSNNEKRKLLLRNDSESEDEDFCDDVLFAYKRDSD